MNTNHSSKNHFSNSNIIFLILTFPLTLTSLMIEAVIKFVTEMIPTLCIRFCCFSNYSNSGSYNRAPLILYKHLMRQCDKLPEGPKQHYKFQIKQVIA